MTVIVHDAVIARYNGDLKPESHRSRGRRAYHEPEGRKTVAWRWNGLL